MKRARNLLIIAMTILLLNPDSGLSQQANFSQSIPFSSDDSINIFLLRGLTRESGHWGQQFFQYVKEEFLNAKITTLDLPGAGVHFQEKAGLTVSKLMEFMKVHSQEEIEATRGQNIIMATSLGGMVATEWISKYPEDFQALIMIRASFKGICSFSERVNPKIRMELLSVPFTLKMVKKEERLLRINSNDTTGFGDNLKEWKEIQVLRPMSTANLIRQTIAGLRYAPPTHFPEIPTLVVGSFSDRLVQPGCIVKVRDHFGGDIVWNDVSGHGIPIDQPEWLVDNVKNWLDFEAPTQDVLAINP
ncbi:MAG: alpha/beta hydrolase [Flavobacteriales bacterium]|jgi:pimeloyl-ACP methyl ester carboxylesterase|nr:alpha/beta hydrolase [Flavobacteriales bacterium]MBT3963625.1 alpha/beta hydrolase [Flavobacteriales bacterium]MBT4705719.1 alpha/beta hydrolase [Flavobacteriales bacterium]MBT4930995.1 alpha/beta hydrolase [Flavobacteriales bacterium]MBT5132666.1 alpha/beta hydrolase [Flavobacteriales bacterium]